MSIDERNGTLLAISGEGSEAGFYAKPIDAKDWTVLASLDRQGVRFPYALFFGPDNALFTFERNTDLQLVGLVKLSDDGTVLSRFKFSQPLPGSFEPHGTGIVCTKDKIILM